MGGSGPFGSAMRPDGSRPAWFRVPSVVELRAGHVFWHIGVMGIVPYFTFRSFFSEHHAHRLTEELRAGGGGGKGNGGWSSGGKMGSPK
jgi:hypothetical protein